jgi:hypothetical protein
MPIQTSAAQIQQKLPRTSISNVEVERALQNMVAAARLARREEGI